MTARKHLYVWVLPLIFWFCSLIQYQFPGDEYGLYAFGSIAGSWIAMLLPVGDIHNPWIPFSIATTGALILAAVGLLMDWLRVRNIIWASQFGIAAVVVLVRTVSMYPSLEKALSKNGSWFAYGFFSINVGLYISVVLSLLEHGVRSARQRLARRDPQRNETADADQRTA